MKKFLLVLFSTAIILSVSTLGITQGFAAEISGKSSVGVVSFVSDAQNTAYPNITKFTPVKNGVRVSWSKYDGAAKYRLYIFDNGKWKKIATTSSTSYVHKNPAYGMPYLYTVRAVNSDGSAFVSDYNRSGWENIVYAPPVISSVTNTNDGVSVKWNKQSGVDSYRVYKKTNGSGWKNIADVTGSSYVDKNVASGVSYSYTIRYLDSEGNLISYYNSGKSIKYVESPSITKIENTATGAKISWTKSDGAAKYRVYYRDVNNNWKKIGNTTSTSFTHENLKTGTTYTYTVRCLDSKNNFVSSFDKTGVSNMFITTPQITSLTNVYGGVQVKWGKLSGAEKYRVYRKTSDSNWTKIGETESNSYVDKNVISGNSYSYTARCFDAAGKPISCYNDGDSITYVEAPTITKIENTATGSKISWTKSAGASKYRVYYLDSNNNWKKIGNTTSTNFTHEKLKAGSTYTYTVRCLDSRNNFVSAYDKAGKSNLFLAPPSLSSVSKTSNGNLIKWADVEGVAGYRLYRKTIGTSWKKLADVSVTSYVDTSAKTGNIYTYTLRCLDENNKLISYYISDTKYYVNGKLADGKVTENGETYYFSNGLFRTGYQTIDGKKYYFNSNGKIEKNNIVGSEKEGWYYADSNGVCCESKEIRLAAEYMMKYCKGDTLEKKMKSGFMYMANNFPYRRDYNHPKNASHVAQQAITLFENRSGNCFQYAAGFACIAKIAGYRTRMVIGTTAGSPHGWTEVLVDGQWLICDPDAQLPGYGVPDYWAYMMRYHYWNIVPNVKCELIIEDGKAIWK